MGSRLIVLLMFIFLLTNISALCEEGQIDINSASAEKLDEIVYIGPARAEQIIALRPFDSVDDLVRVSGIGDVYLSAIKTQNLACVGNVKENKEEEEKVVVDEENLEENVEEFEQIESPKELQTINLNPQVIKSEENNEKEGRNYALYGFVVFCIFIGILFLIKSRKNKNEFR